MPSRFPHLPARSRQGGLSIVEFMVGVAIGLVVVGGAIKLFVDLLNSNRRQLVEVRLNQDLRAAADLVARDLRRSGYWAGAATAFAATPVTNPFASAAETSVAAGRVTYAYDRNGDSAIAAAERFGFQLNGNRIEALIGGAWQPLTDPGSVLITNFSVENDASATQTYSRANSCPCVYATGVSACTAAAVAAGANPPQVVVRWVNIVIEGRAPNDAAMTRRIRESVRLRNDEIRGVCP